MKVNWTPKMEAMLGTDTDWLIAMRLGIEDHQVSSRRRRLGIGPACVDHWVYSLTGYGSSNPYASLGHLRDLTSECHKSFKHSWLIIERGAMGPEHMPYIEKRLRAFGNYIIELADSLREES